MKTAYTDYCVNHDKAEQLMEKYESTPDISRLLQRGVETIQAQVSCFNMGSILIKPVQRILKYPLILNELVKVYTDRRLPYHKMINFRNFFYYLKYIAYFSVHRRGSPR